MVWSSSSLSNPWSSKSPAETPSRMSPRRWNSSTVTGIILFSDVYARMYKALMVRSLSASVVMVAFRRVLSHILGSVARRRSLPTDSHTSGSAGAGHRPFSQEERSPRRTCPSYSSSAGGAASSASVFFFGTCLAGTNISCTSVPTLDRQLRLPEHSPDMDFMA